MKLTKKQSILTGVAVAFVAAIGSAALLAPQDVKDRALNLVPGHTEEAPAVEKQQDLPETPAVQPQTTVDNGGKKLAS